MPAKKHDWGVHNGLPAPATAENLTIARGWIKCEDDSLTKWGKPPSMSALERVTGLWRQSVNKILRDPQHPLMLLIGDVRAGLHGTTQSTQQATANTGPSLLSYIESGLPPCLAVKAVGRSLVTQPFSDDELKEVEKAEALWALRMVTTISVGARGSSNLISLLCKRFPGVFEVREVDSSAVKTSWVDQYEDDELDV